MITVTIDGKVIQTEPSKTIIEAAFEHGIHVPHFCWHPDLTISGNCRMCLVEVEKLPKQVIACSTLCMDGMVVHVNSEKAIQARDAVTEFILINHPLDCPICDEAGECKLQEYAYYYGHGHSRFDEEKAHKRKRVELGPHVMFDAERCISCSRCIRFCEEKVGEPQLTFVHRGDRVTIETYPGKKLDNRYSMNVIDLCPVGALTSKEFRFRSRAWDMSSTPGICTGCARGCNVNVWVRQNEILRYTARENQEVNDFWICDSGRLESWKYVHAETRISGPMLKRSGSLVSVSWEEAIASAASELKGFKADEVAVIGSPFDLCEDLFAASRFARGVLQTSWIDTNAYVVPGDKDDFLICEDKTPNSAGARLLGMVSEKRSKPLEDIARAIRDGRIKALIACDSRLSEDAEFLDAANELSLLVVIAVNVSPLTEMADVLLAASSTAEKTGTLINIDGQIQITKASITTAENERWIGAFSMSRLDKFASEFDRWGKMPRRDCRSTWSIFTQLASAMGSSWNYKHPEDVFEDMVAAVPELTSRSYESLGRWGARLNGSQPQHKLPYVYSDVHN